MKITFISDTHGKEPILSGGDFLIHTGDLTIHGYRREVLKQLNYLHEQLDKYKYVIVIPGNHDFWVEKCPNLFKEACVSGGIVGLIHEGISLEGLNIWGSPATPWFHDWAFNYRSEIQEIWEKIPENTDILLSHGPPYGVLDKTMFGDSVGCDYLMEKVLEIKPKIHAFGHIHESSGVSENKDTLFINSSVTTIDVVLNDDGSISYEEK